MAILGSFMQYVITFVVLAAIGLLGGFLGVQLRKRKNAKDGAKAQDDKND